MFDVLLGGPSFAIASSRVDMPGTSSVTLYRLGEIAAVQAVNKSAPKTPKKRRRLGSTIAMLREDPSPPPGLRKRQ
jgi:hypothetical protein